MRFKIGWALVIALHIDDVSVLDDVSVMTSVPSPHR